MPINVLSPADALFGGLFFKEGIMTKKKNHYIVMTMVEVGVMAALGFVLDELSGIMFKGVFVNGGSIGIAMVCVLVMAFRRGFVPALATGVVMGLLDLATGPYIIPANIDAATTVTRPATAMARLLIAPSTSPISIALAVPMA